jgi:N12 class adenine-specific DNA methylase
VWEDPAQAERLARRYNDLFNATVVARYHGRHLSTPGLAANFAPHTHQLAAVWRTLSGPTVLLGHCVGAGKTAMVMGGLQMRRLGLALRPAYVVPNLLLRWGEDVLVGSLQWCGGRWPHMVGSDDPKRPHLVL